jgi:uncharacterized RDD family membrane protein YckC
MADDLGRTSGWGNMDPVTGRAWSDYDPASTTPQGIGRLGPDYIGPGSPQRPPSLRHSLRLADYASRAVGFIIDYVVIILASVIVGYTAAGLTHVAGLVVLAFAVSPAYVILTTGAESSGTIGMRMMNIVLVNARTELRPIGYGRASLRWFLALVFAAVPFAIFVDLLWPLWDPRNQTLHDKLAGTAVLKADYEMGMG